MKNTQIVKFDDGREILLSYGVPVAAFIPGRGYIRSAEKYSVTTSKHANGYAGREAPAVPLDEFRALVRPLEPAPLGAPLPWLNGERGTTLPGPPDDDRPGESPRFDCGMIGVHDKPVTSALSQKVNAVSDAFG